MAEEGVRFSGEGEEVGAFGVKGCNLREEGFNGFGDVPGRRRGGTRGDIGGEVENAIEEVGGCEGEGWKRAEDLDG